MPLPNETATAYFASLLQKRIESLYANLMNGAPTSIIAEGVRLVHEAGIGYCGNELTHREAAHRFIDVRSKHDFCSSCERMLPPFSKRTTPGLDHLCSVCAGEQMDAGQEAIDEADEEYKKLTPEQKAYVDRSATEISDKIQSEREAAERQLRRKADEMEMGRLRLLSDDEQNGLSPGGSE